jgi:hypothetical protein
MRREVDQAEPRDLERGGAVGFRSPAVGEPVAYRGDRPDRPGLKRRLGRRRWSEGGGSGTHDESAQLSDGATLSTARRHGRTET